MSTKVATGITALSSYFGGKSARSAANEASRQQRALLQEIHDRAYAAYGPEAAEKAVQKAIEDIARAEAQTQIGASNDLYARGMGERTPGAMASISEAAMKQKLESRGEIEREYPKYLSDALSGLQGGYADVADRATQRASDATALPIDLLGLYMNTKGIGGTTSAKTTTPRTLAPGVATDNLVTGLSNMQNPYNRPKNRKYY